MTRILRRIVALALILCMVLPITALAADNGYDGVLTLVHTNDVHSNVAVEPYVKAIGALQCAGLINGVGNGRFAPLSGATRAEAASIISRVLTSGAFEAAAA